jgi:hypothetical protein
MDRKKKIEYKDVDWFKLAHDRIQWLVVLKMVYKPLGRESVDQLSDFLLLKVGSVS